MKELDQYTYYLRNTRNRSELTIKSYISELKMFFGYVNKPISEITAEDAMNYINYCSTELGNSAKTRCHKIASIKMFYIWLGKYKDVHVSMDILERPKIEKTLPKHFTQDESLLLLEKVKDDKRMYAMSLMFLGCGLRISEMSSLNRNDIREDNTLVITGKGNKQRTVYLTDEIVNAVNDYLKTRTDDREELWTSAKKTRLTPNTIRRLYKRYFAEIGHPDYSVHKLRHTYATNMYQSGAADILELQKLLGHESISTTQIYTHVSDAKLRECANNNPILKALSGKGEAA